MGMFKKKRKLHEIYGDRSSQNLNLNIKAGSNSYVLIRATKLILIEEIVLYLRKYSKFLLLGHLKALVTQKVFAPVNLALACC